jgi:hypothetical protein
VRTARERALQAGLASVAHDRSPVADFVRRQFKARLAYERADADVRNAMAAAHGALYRQAVQAARQTLIAMRASDEIGDDAFHRMEEQLDWLEMASGGNDD